MLAMIEGKKTWGTVIIGLAVLVAVNVLGVPVLEVPPDPDWVTRAIELLGLGFLRSGVAKV